MLDDRFRGRVARCRLFMVWRPVVRIIESMLIYPDASDLINLFRERLALEYPKPMEPRTVYIGNTVEKQMALIQIGICGNGSWLSDLPIDEQTVTLYEALGGGCQAGEAGPTDSSTVAPPPLRSTQPTPHRCLCPPPRSPL